jgi:uncharacterized protein (DUF885 family)
MRSRRHLVGLSLLAGPLWLAGCGPVDPPSARPEDTPSTLAASLRAANAETAELYRVVETWFDQYLALNPIHATALGDHRFDDRFGDYASVSWVADSLGIEQEALERLQSVDLRELRGEDLVTYQAFKRQRELSIGGYRYPAELLALNHVGSWPIEFALLGSGRGAHPFRTTQDYDHFLARMDGFVTWVDQAINNLRAGVGKGVVLPQVVIERTLPQLDAFGRVEDPRQTVFWRPLLNFPAGPTVADRRRLLQAYEERLRTRVLPAYRRLHDYLAQDYLAQARNTVAWSDLPSGDLWYAHLVRLHTTLDLSPDDVHELGLREVARLQANFAAQLQGPLGVPGDIRAAFDALRADPKFHFVAAQPLLASYESLRARVEARIATQFTRRAKARLDIRAMDAFQTLPGPPVAYAAPSADGARPGMLLINTSSLASRPAFALDAQYLQFAVPGHHYQVALAQQAPGLPGFRRFGSDAAFSDGWALYAVSLGSDLGLLADPYTQFGALNLELLHAARLVIDTGLHARGWTRQRAIDYLGANTAASEADIVAEVDRCIALPAQGLAGKAGQLKILELRRKAEAKLGDRFDVRAFHEAIVGSGSLPLPVLEAKLARWTEARR